jgi:hypothetical protein
MSGECESQRPESGLEGERGSARNLGRRPDAGMPSISWSKVKTTREKKQGQSTSHWEIEIVSEVQILHMRPMQCKERKMRSS